MPISKTCEECGGEFQVPPSMSARRWCNWECRTAHPRRHASKPRPPCVRCGEPTVAKPSKGRKYCSHECYAAHVEERGSRRKRVIRSCGWCEKTFEKRPSEIRKGRGKFCSKSCAAKGRPVAKTSVIADDSIAVWASGTNLDYEAEFRVGRWAIDLAFPAQKVAVELDGVYWHSLPDMVDRDKRKDADLKRRGWTVYRIVMTREDTPESIARRIEEVVNKGVRTWAA